MSTTEKQYDAIVIGAGLAGIACSIRLRKQGKSVLVIEKNEKAGGKLDRFESEGYSWDKGPSLFTEPELIVELFELCGKNPVDYFEYVRHNESCRYFYPTGENIVLSAEKKKTLKEISEKISSDAASRYERYLADAAKDYSSIGSLFLDDPKPGPTDVLKKKFLKHYPFFLKRKMCLSLHDYNRKRLKEEKLVKIFNRFGTYNGSNPYKMSGLYSMIPHLELNNGTFFPKGGMRRIVDALFSLSKEIGVEYRFNEAVTANKIGDHYQVTGTETHTTEKLICAIDHMSFYRNVFPDNELIERYTHQERSTSGLVFYWGVEKVVPELGLHNIFFSEDYRKEFTQLFKAKELCDQPTIYVHLSSVIEKSDAPDNGQNWFVMINTPAGVPSTQAYRQRMKQYVIDRIYAHFNVNIEQYIKVENYWDSLSIAEQTGSYLGALYGSSSNSLSATFKRHGNTSKKHKNLFFCGGTVHPGGGIPLVMRSAKIASELAK